MDSLCSEPQGGRSLRYLRTQPFCLSVNMIAQKLGGPQRVNFIYGGEWM